MEERVVLEHLTRLRNLFEDRTEGGPGRHVGQHLVEVGPFGLGCGGAKVDAASDEPVEGFDIVAMCLAQ